MMYVLLYMVFHVTVFLCDWRRCSRMKEGISSYLRWHLSFAAELLLTMDAFIIVFAVIFALISIITGEAVPAL